MSDRVVLLMIPQLRRKDVSPGCLASLDSLAARGAETELVPSFPGLAASSFASAITGTGPYEHGLIGNAYFDREARKVVSGPLPDSAIRAPRIWDRLRQARPGAKTLLWFGPNTRGADVEFSAGVDADWDVVTNPPGLGESLVSAFGPFPRPEVEAKGEPPRLEATTWILKTAAATIQAERPDLAIVRIPYLGQVARRFGPDGREAGRALRELETVLGPFLKAEAPDSLVIAATETVTAPVSGPAFPNLVLRGLGLLALDSSPGGGVDVDLERSAAFALVDHQLAHIYLNDPSQAANVASAFAGLHDEGVALVAPGARRAELGLDHPRAGDVVLVSTPDRWFAPDWWSSDEERPAGPAPSGLRIGGPIDPRHVKGSLGATPAGESYLGVAVASRRGVLGDAPQLAARDLAGLVLDALLPDRVTLRKNNIDGRDDLTSGR